MYNRLELLLVVGKDNLVVVVEGTTVENASVDDINDTIDKNVDATAIMFLFGSVLLLLRRLMM
jgi:hypothetical protein